MSRDVPIPVRSGGQATDYEVIIRPGIRKEVALAVQEAAPAVRRWVVVADTNTARLYGAEAGRALREAGLDGTVFITPAGEAHKTLDAWQTLTDELLAHGLGRDCGVLAVGGGVVTDLAGFVAATFMRGIPVLQMPTSLLAMIDASVGGKTGVDTPRGKNLVGAFHPPVAVIMDPEVLATLPESERAQGLVEALKHGAIRDRGYGERVAAAVPDILSGRLGAAADILRRSVEIKAEVVSQDEREGGVREVLNFGHTVGHALERCSSYALAHGTAVAQGMLWESRLGEALGITARGTTEMLNDWLEPLGLPLAPDPVDADALVQGLHADKKVRDGRIRVVLLEGPGRVAPASEGWAHMVSAEQVLEAAG